MGGGKVEGMGGVEVGTEIGIYNEKKKKKNVVLVPKLQSASGIAYSGARSHLSRSGSKEKEILC